MPVYWLVDLEQGRVEVRSQPCRDGDYGVIRTFEGGERVELPGVGEEIPVTELLA